MTFFNQLLILINELLFYHDYLSHIFDSLYTYFSIYKIHARIEGKV